MALGDLFIVTVFQKYRSQEVINTYTYHQITSEAGTLSPSEALSNAFDLEFLTAGVGYRGGAISNLLSVEAIRIQNLFTPSDAHEEIYDPVLTGGAASAAAPNFNAYAFRTQWLGSTIRRGSKRIAGVINDLVVNGAITAGGLTSLGAFATSMSNSLLADDYEFEPVVIKRVKETDPVTGEITYRLPENPSEANHTAGLTWGVLPLISTQSTRKIGRGS